MELVEKVNCLCFGWIIRNRPFVFKSFSSSAYSWLFSQAGSDKVKHKLTVFSSIIWHPQSFIKVQWLSCLPLLCCMHQSYKMYLFRMAGRRMQSTSWITSTGVWRKSQRSTSPPPLTQLLKQLLRWFIRVFGHGYMTAVSMMSCYGSRQTVTSSSSSMSCMFQACPTLSHLILNWHKPSDRQWICFTSSITILC